MSRTPCSRYFSKPLMLSAVQRLPDADRITSLVERNTPEQDRDHIAVTYNHTSPFDRNLWCVTRPKALPEHDLVLRLCQMPVELASPLLSSDISELTDDVLMAVIDESSPAHAAVIAARQRLRPRVIKALVRKGNGTAIAALLANQRVRLDEEDRENLLRLGLQDETIRKGLLARADTRAEMIRRARFNTQGAGCHDLNLRFLKAVRSGRYERALELAAPRLGLSIDALRSALSSPSALPHVLLFHALELDKAVYIHSLPQWLALCGAEVSIEQARHPLVMAAFEAPPQSAAKRLKCLCKA